MFAFSVPALRLKVLALFAGRAGLGDRGTLRDHIAKVRLWNERKPSPYYTIVSIMLLDIIDRPSD
jgi:hypothetical protein